MKLGILGLPYSGKTALFEAVTGAHGAAIEHGSTTHTATVAVPDDRLDAITKLGAPKKITPAYIDFVDIAGITADDDRDHAATTLAPLRDADGLVHVVRLFEWAGAPPHPRGTLDPARDAAELETELLIADLVVIERRLEKLEKQILKSTPHQEQDKKELLLMKRLKEKLEAGARAADIHLSEQETLTLKAFQLLSVKPVIHVLNVHENELGSDATRAAAQTLGDQTVIISAKIEKEISELDPEERAEFIQDMGLGDPAARRVIRASYQAVGLRSFFTGTAPGEELRAWTISAGDTALIAAGKIHTDIARGFIRAEVVSYNDFIKANSWKQAQAQNLARLEGKNYEVADGDVIIFRFKV